MVIKQEHKILVIFPHPISYRQLYKTKINIIVEGGWMVECMYTITNLKAYIYITKQYPHQFLYSY